MVTTTPDAGDATPGRAALRQIAVLSTGTRGDPLGDRAADVRFDGSERTGNAEETGFRDLRV